MKAFFCSLKIRFSLLLWSTLSLNSHTDFNWNYRIFTIPTGFDEFFLDKKHRRFQFSPGIEAKTRIWCGGFQSHRISRSERSGPPGCFGATLLDSVESCFLETISEFTFEVRSIPTESCHCSANWNTFDGITWISGNPLFLVIWDRRRPIFYLKMCWNVQKMRSKRWKNPPQADFLVGHFSKTPSTPCF